MNTTLTAARSADLNDSIMSLLRFSSIFPLSNLSAVCQNLVDGKVDLTSWRHKIDDDERDDEDDEEVEEDDDDDDEPATDAEEVDASFDKYSPFKGGSLTIGCCGIPNVGKSSVMNALIGKKVVSVSKTPGHTKHFQT